MHLRSWLKIFKAEDIWLINGEDLLTNLPEVILKFEKLLGLPTFFKEENFVKNELGFYCYRVTQLSSQPACLTAKFKGKTRGQLGDRLKQDLEASFAKLREFYAPYNQEFYDLVGQDFDW